MAEFTYTEALEALSTGASVDLDELLTAVCAPAWDPVVYLADFARQALLPLCEDVPGEQVAGTLAGLAFTTGQPAVSARDGHARVWVPVIEQTARVGVLALSVADTDTAVMRQAELLGVFAGLVVSGMSRVSDTPHMRRMGRSMSLQASMQWDMLPPWSIRVHGGLISGMLEPAYDIAGDAYDYATDGAVLHFAVIDGMGHGIGSTMLTGLAMGAYRHGRRDSASLPDIHAAMDAAIAGGYDDLSFATGIIGTLTLSTGRLDWTCAGHPPPLQLRGRHVVAELDCDPTLPWGLGSGTPAVSSLSLEPDDAILLYTDGVIEAHGPDREAFGLDRLTDLLEREAASDRQPEELLAGLVRELLRYQDGHLRDDATLLLLRWAGFAP